MDRCESWCRLRATSSLPEPLGPVMRTLAADVPHALGLAHHLLPIDLLLEDLGLGDEVRLVGGVLDGDEDAVQVQGLADEVERAFLDAVHGRVDVGVAGDHDDRGLDPVGDELLKDFSTVHPGHLDVAEDGVVLLLFRHFTGVGAVFGRIHLVFFHLQDLLEGVADGTLVVNNQNLHTLETFMQIYGLFYYICKAGSTKRPYKYDYERS